jgi:hypothetical protein
LVRDAISRQIATNDVFHHQATRQAVFAPRVAAAMWIARRIRDALINKAASVSFHA